MGYSCPKCKGPFKSGPESTLIHSCKEDGLNYRITQDGGVVNGHNHPKSFLARDKSTSATKPDTAEQKKKGAKKEKKLDSD